MHSFLLPTIVSTLVSATSMPGPQLATAPNSSARPLDQRLPADVPDPSPRAIESPAPNSRPAEQLPPPVPPAAKTPSTPTFVPGIRYWIRSFGRQVTSFDRENPDHEYGLLHQARLHALASYGPVSGFIQFQDARNWGFEQSTTSNDANTDLHQGYMELQGNRGGLWGSVRLGRQEIVVGSRRLFSERPWNPVGQSFDALRVRGKTARVGFDVFAAMLAPPQTLAFEQGDTTLAVPTRGGYVGGAYVSVRAHTAAVVDAALFIDYEGPTATDINRDRRIISPGLRLHGQPYGGLRYELEGYYQAGAQYRVPHRAWSLAALASYEFDVRTTPVLHAGYLVASGQACTNDPVTGSCEVGETSREFFDFYRRRHGYQGMVDLALMRNIRDLELGLALAPHKLLKLNLDYHFFQLQQPNGRWWRVPNNLIGSGWNPDNPNRNLGHELDVRFRAQPFKPLGIDVGYGIYLPLAAATAISGGSDSRHFWYLSLTTEF